MVLVTGASRLFSPRVFGVPNPLLRAGRGVSGVMTGARVEVWVEMGEGAVLRAVARVWIGVRVEEVGTWLVDTRCVQRVVWCE